MDLILFKLLRRGRRNGMSDDASRTSRETGRRNFDDLAAIDFADDALNEHLLRGIAIAHKRAVLLQQVGKAVGAERHMTLVGNIRIAECLHALEEQGVGVAGRSRRGVVVAVVLSRRSEGIENVRIELYWCSAWVANPRPVLKVPAAYLYADQTISSPHLLGASHFHPLGCTPFRDSR